MTTNTTTNPRHFAKLTDSTNQIEDNVDFLHSGLTKTLSLSAQGNYVINGCNVTQTDGGTYTIFGVTSGIYHQNNTRITFTGANVEMATGPHPTAGYNWYALLVITGAGAVAIRNQVGGANLTGALKPKIADYTAGDVIVGVIKVEGASTATSITRPFQFLTYNTDEPTILTIKESLTAPAEETEYGKLYVKSVGLSNLIYFQSDDGTEYNLTTTNADIFQTINCTSGSSPVASGPTDTLNLTAGAGISVTGNSGSDTVTFVNTSPNTDQNIFQTIACPAGTNPVADSNMDILTFEAGTGIDITGNSTTDTVTIAVDVSDFLTSGANNRVITAVNADTMNAEANMTFSGSALAVTGSISASTNITAGFTLTTAFEYVQAPLTNALISAIAAAATPITTQTIQWLEVGVGAGANFYQLPIASALANGTTITLKNLSVIDAIIIPTISGYLETIDGAVFPFVNMPPANIGMAPGIAGTGEITLPGMRAITLTSFTDGGIAFANPALVFGGSTFITGGSGWMVIGTY